MAASVLGPARTRTMSVTLARTPPGSKVGVAVGLRSAPGVAWSRQSRRAAGWLESAAGLRAGFELRRKLAGNIQIQLAVRDARLDLRPFNPFIPRRNNNPVRRRRRAPRHVSR